MNTTQNTQNVNNSNEISTEASKFFVDNFHILPLAAQASHQKAYKVAQLKAYGRRALLFVCSWTIVLFCTAMVHLICHNSLAVEFALTTLVSLVAFWVTPFVAFLNLGVKESAKNAGDWFSAFSYALLGFDFLTDLKGKEELERLHRFGTDLPFFYLWKDVEKEFHTPAALKYLANSKSLLYLAEAQMEEGEGHQEYDHLGAVEALYKLASDPTIGFNMVPALATIKPIFYKTYSYSK